jgi:hypothetical protein
MTSAWALVYMLCNPTCIAQYAMPYETRSACIRSITKQERKHASDKYICIPISKD